LLVIVAIMAIMATASIVSVRSGQDAARLRGATRDIFAAVRHARSLTLVSKEPCVVTYALEKQEDEVSASIVVDGAKIIRPDAVKKAQTLSGEEVWLEPQETGDDGTAPRPEPVDGAQPADEATAGGESMDEILFAPIASEVVKGVRIKVEKEDDVVSHDVSSRRAKPRISVFSNVDYLIGRHNEAKARQAQSKEEDKENPDRIDGKEPEADQEPVKIVWEVNGRTEPHRIWVYLDGTDPGSGLSIQVDRFGGMKVLGQDGEEIGK
jgi:hypothetical protein